MRYTIIEDEIGGTAVLTTESAASRYGLPVLEIVAEDIRGAFGPADRIGAVTAAAVVAGWAAEPGRTPDELVAATAFLSQWPEGPQAAAEGKP